MRTGETREITITLPADYPAGELAGKEAKFQVTVREIKQKELPDLDDEFAKSLGANSFDELKEQVRQSMVASGENEAEKAYTGSIVEKIVAGAQVEVPAVLADRQVEQRYQTLIKNLAYQGLTIDKYLTEVGKAEEELREEIRPRAEGEVRTDLVLEAVRKAEKIEATDEEIERRVSELAAVSRQKDVSAFRRELERSGRLGTMIDNLAREKTVKFLVEKAIIDMAD
jgi:trigger factor